MVYYVTGSMLSVMGSHPLFQNVENLTNEKRASKKVLEQDLPRETCFVEPEDFRKISARLKQFPVNEVYTQGQLTGRLLKLAFGISFPFDKSGVNMVEQFSRIRQPRYQDYLPLFNKALHGEHGFIFMQDDEVCALSFEYYPGIPHPSWFIALLRGVNKPQKECKVDILSSVAPGGFSACSVPEWAAYRPEYQTLDFETALATLKSHVSVLHIRDVLQMLFPSGSEHMSACALGLANFDFPHFEEAPIERISVAERMHKLRQYMAVYEIFVDTIQGIARHLEVSEKGMAFIGNFGNYERYMAIFNALKRMLDKPSASSRAAFEETLAPISDILMVHQCKNVALQKFWFGMLDFIYTVLGVFSQDAHNALATGAYKKTASLRLFESGLGRLSASLAHPEHDNHQACV